MDRRILEFIGDLRRAEIRISPSEALDALTASAEVGLRDRETFKTALAATLVKESRDLPTFDRLFDLYFLDLQALGAGLKKALGPEDPGIQGLLDRLVAEEGIELSDLTELMLRGGGSEMELAIRRGGQGAGLERLQYFLQIGYFSRRIFDRFDWEAIERDIARLLRAMEAMGIESGRIARIRNYLDLRLEAFRRMIRQHVERELERRAYRSGERLRRESLTDKPLFALTPEEVRHIALLARVGLSDEEVARFQLQLSEILDYFERLKHVDTEGIAPTAPLACSTRTRYDPARGTTHRIAATYGCPLRSSRPPASIVSKFGENRCADSSPSERPSATNPVSEALGVALSFHFRKSGFVSSTANSL